MKKDEFRIFLVDDEEMVRRGFSLLLRSAGYLADSFSSVKEFMESFSYDGPGCILLDIFLEEESGLELQDQIISKINHLPIIYITGYGSIPMSVRALKKGAINFLQKPVDDQQLIAAVEEALKKSSAMVRERDETLRIKSLLDKLTQREYDVFRLLLTGMLNKQIAAELNIAEHTVKLHRGHITQKLNVKSVAEMVRLAETLNIK